MDDIQRLKEIDDELEQLWMNYIDKKSQLVYEREEIQRRISNYKYSLGENK